MWLFVSGLSSSHMNARRSVLRVFAKVSAQQPIQKPYIASSLRTPPPLQGRCAQKKREIRSLWPKRRAHFGEKCQGEDIGVFGRKGVALIRLYIRELMIIVCVKLRTRLSGSD